MTNKNITSACFIYTGINVYRIFILVTFIFSIMCSSQSHSVQTPSRQINSNVNVQTKNEFSSASKIPDILLERADMGGNIHLKPFCSGKVVIIVFWATWCDSCKGELVSLNARYADLGKKGIEILAIAMDTPETVAQVQAEINKYRLSFTVVLDTESLASGFLNPAAKAPFTVIIDKNMKIIYSHEGYLPGDIDRIVKVATDAAGN